MNFFGRVPAKGNAVVDSSACLPVETLRLWTAQAVAGVGSECCGCNGPEVARSDLVARRRVGSGRDRRGSRCVRPVQLLLGHPETHPPRGPGPVRGHQAGSDRPCDGAEARSDRDPRVDRVLGAASRAGCCVW